ncbi:sterol desaturase family protein [Massilia sp. 9096]|uniref:sterol desaturase family protein n=1 Tax=Massilia sp. 9096 TaxID=1500894 RepID=UPI00055B731B|nr:sterol desaturase family protein [Massilia sp. 9096]
MIQTFLDWFAALQGWLFETVVQPAMFAAGLGEYIEDAFDGVEWFLTGACELAALYLVLRPLETLIPAQRIDDRARARRARRNDFLYTVVHRLGLFSMAVFFTLDPLMDRLAGALRMQGVHPFNLEAWMSGFHPLAAFLLYMVVLDFFDYWLHRAQHKFRWSWALHSLHHSQRDMNLWSDDRNHLLDDLLRDVTMACIALAIGVAPSQYVLLVSVSRVLQSLQHANVRIHFGRFGEHLLVSPRFHRTHHALKHGHAPRDRELGGCNFGVLLPVWDQLFGTANFAPGWQSTGVVDQFERIGADGALRPARDYGRGFWRQQWLGLVRLCEAFGRKTA